MRFLPVLALLPALILGPTLGGLVAWVHSHGPEGGHLHLLAAPAEHGDLGAPHDWHAAQHRRSHEGGTHEEEQPAPEGLRIELPAILAAAPRGSADAPATSIAPATAVPSPPWHLACVENTHRPDYCRAAGPPGRAEGSGIAALLRSSRAILI